MSQREEVSGSFTPFWPLCMIALSLTVFFGWQVTVAVRQYVDLLRLQDRQAELSVQAAQAEGKLQAVMIDLLKLAKTDSDAKAIVNKYGIKFNPAAAPQASAPSGTLLPQASPQPKTAGGNTSRPPAERPDAGE